MKTIFNDIYKAVEARGLITHDTSKYQFFDKLLEEVEEVNTEIDEGNDIRLMEELTDVITVCSNMIKHLGGDPIHELEKNLKRNNERALKMILNR